MSLLPMTGAGATEEPAGSDESSSGAAGTPADPDPEDLAGGVEVVRYAGSDPYEMSIELARALVVAGDGSSEWVVLASGESWADAVAAGPLAASLGAPVVLVPLGGLQSTAARPDFVEFLRSAGVRRAVIVGDPETLPNHEPSVLYGLGMLPRNIERVHGSDPVGAAIAMAERIGAAAEFGDLGRTVIIASDQSVADAVAVGPLAAAGPFPLLLTAPDALDPRITAYLTDQEVAHIVMVGGTTAIAPAVQEAIETASITVTRLAGHDRIDTAQLAADLFEQHTADDPTCTDGRTRVGLAPAQQPEQALTAGPLLAQACAPLRFTESDRLPADLRNTLYLSRDVSPGAHLTVFGSGVSVPDSTLDVNTPPVRFAAFNFRPNADADALVGVLEVIDEAGVRRSFPVTEVTLGREWGIPSDWWQRPHNFISYRPKISWSSDGHRLAYWSVDAGALYVLDLRDGELRRIAQVDSQMDGFGSTLNWSPDGSRLAFDAIVEEESTLSDPRLTVNGVSEFTSELFVHDVESGETTRLTHNNFVDSVGPWSPDGTRLSFIRSPASSTWMSPAGLVAYRRLIVLDLTTKESHELHPYVLDTLWSPDGETIAFSAVPNGSFNTVAKSLYLATPDGSQVQQVPGPSCDGCRRYATKFPLPSIHLDGWSPTGDQIAYSALFWADRKGLTRQVASDETSEVFHESEDELFASGRSERLRFIGWRPDGRNLMYLKSNCQRGTENEGVELSVVQVAADGSGSSELLDLMPLLGDSPASCYPTYGLAPGGQSIILVDQSLGLHAVGLEGADFDRLVTPTPRAIEVSYRIHNPCSVEWTHSGVQIGCRYSTGQF
ncbi:MAG: cell wall-binding repeat-containing protein [Acidimicrobiaceae bacterium]|nr:cell wall-binding repeat-containing protein [Acidimicrobiaceae bacterium]